MSSLAQNSDNESFILRLLKSIKFVTDSALGSLRPCALLRSLLATEINREQKAEVLFSLTFRPRL